MAVAFHAELLAQTVRRRFAANWGLAETGAAGPTGNRYGDAAGHVCLAVASADGKTRVKTIETGSGDRQANMETFAAAALDVLMAALRG